MKKFVVKEIYTYEVEAQERNLAVALVQEGKGEIKKYEIESQMVDGD